MNDERLVMYIVLPKSLKMSAEKVGVTCGHAVQFLMQSYWQTRELRGSDRADCRRMQKWLETTHTKIILGANDKDFSVIRHLDGAMLVVDGSRNVSREAWDGKGKVYAVSFWPMLELQAASIIHELKPL